MSRKPASIRRRQLTAAAVAAMAVATALASWRPTAAQVPQTSPSDTAATITGALPTPAGQPAAKAGTDTGPTADQKVAPVRRVAPPTPATKARLAPPSKGPAAAGVAGKPRAPTVAADSKKPAAKAKGTAAKSPQPAASAAAKTSPAVTR